ncbi:phage recombination protein Bet [Streptomyces drozdowiczii]|uniref:Phage recombination protein Bet n=1 Tax=Streptomyces drozdowiczii TaxID=202862 RepID=A0ABY6PPC3_9ACTN|nr:phage recombination protein Bet [Streptomyces drozdowiczii]MCX0246445.1 phage recombination protein Bet [Streptomyces drozdowiczii]UZK54052.1 phage recombination protein Bet [Streptomyces drozdowiczii]
MTTTDIATTAGGSLAIRPDQTQWTPDQAAVLQQSGIDNQVAPAELSAFLHLCQRTRLDPFSRQIYLIGRWDNRQGRKVYTPQTSIDGYRVIAHRAAGDAVHSLGYDDTLWCAKDGRWRDVWLDDEPPAAAKVTVIRNGQRFSAVARHSEYVQTGKDGKPSGLWVKMPATMTAKCAEALALRMAFPHDLAGVYTAEEMAQSDNAGPAEQQLRRVQPGEADPWETAAPQTAAQGRDYLHEAYEAADADTVRRLWLEARADGAVPEYLAQIAAVGKEKAAGVDEGSRPDGETRAVPLDSQVVDAEIVAEALSPEDDYAAAVAELREAAEAAQLENFEQGTEQALGMPLSEASTDAIRALAAQIRPAP